MPEHGLPRRTLLIGAAGAAGAVGFPVVAQVPRASAAVGPGAAMAACPTKTDVVVWAASDTTDHATLHHVHGLVVTPAETVLALTEARFGNAGDNDPHTIVCKRSTDGGLSFSASTFVLDDTDGSSYCGNPTPVVDSSTGHSFAALS